MTTHNNRTDKKQIKIALGKNQWVFHRPWTEDTHNAKPWKYQIDGIVHSLKHQRYFAGKTVTRVHDLPNVRNSIRCSKERSIEPSPTLSDKFR
jgi:hypothetical protein